MYAVIKAGGKQHRVSEGDVIEVELVHGSAGDAITFQPLLVVDDDGKTHVGKALGKATVTVELMGEKKGDKVKVFKYRPKSGYARHTGHRQMLSMVRVTGVSLEGTAKKAYAKKAEATEEPAKEPAAKAPAKASAAKKPAPKKAAPKERDEAAEASS